MFFHTLLQRTVEESRLPFPPSPFPLVGRIPASPSSASSTPDSVIMAILIKSLREVKWRGGGREEERERVDKEEEGERMRKKKLLLYPQPVGRSA